MINSSPNLEVVAKSSNWDDTERFARAHKPEIILIGFNLFAFGEHIKQSDLIKLSKAASPGSTVMILSRAGGRIEAVREAMDSGADGAISAGLNDHELLEALSIAADKGGFFSAGMALELARHDRSEEQSVLSSREQDILAGVAYGHTNQEIAEQLFLSVRTIESHRASIQEKLGIKNRADLVAYAVTHKILEGASHWLGSENSNPRDGS